MDLTNLMVPFCPLFSATAWQSAMVLVEGAILSPGKRTVSAVLRVMGLAYLRGYQNYHRVLNRAVRSSRKASFIRHDDDVVAPSPDASTCRSPHRCGTSSPTPPARGIGCSQHLWGVVSR
ncbi:MAG: hypothetical protein WBA10_05885 [Elainellaceae cyanobacterium]